MVAIVYTSLVALLEIPVTFGLNGEKGNLILPLQLCRNTRPIAQKGEEQRKVAF